MSINPIERLAAAVDRIAGYVGDRQRRGVSHDDADPELGTVECDDAIGFDPHPLLAALDGRGAHVVVFGQVAAILHGSRELTGDLDLLWSGDEREAPRLAAAFGDVDATVTDQDGAALRLDVDAFALPKVLFSSQAASGDCCYASSPVG